MNTKAKEAVIEQLKVQRDAIRESLNRPVLDGTPWLLILEVEGRDMFYGHWEGRRCYRPLSILDWHCCGAVTLSAEGVEKKIGHLRACNATVRKLHSREHAKQILAEVEGYIRNLEAAMVPA